MALVVCDLITLPRKTVLEAKAIADKKDKVKA